MKREPWRAAGRTLAGAATVENDPEVPRRVEARSTVWSGNAASGCISKGNEIPVSKRYLNPVFIAALPVIGKVEIT